MDDVSTFNAIMDHNRSPASSARALGASSWRVMWRYTLPNVIPPNVVPASLCAGGIILVEAGLSLLGAGTPPPTPTWARMVTDAYADIWE